MKQKFILLFVVTDACLMCLTASDLSTTSVDREIENESDFLDHLVKISVVESKPYFMRRWSDHADSTNSNLSIISKNTTSSSRVEFSGFFVDVVEYIAREVPFQVEWSVESSRSGRRRTADVLPLRRVLAGEADVAIVGLLADEFEDIRLMTSNAMLSTSLTLMTSRWRRHDMTLYDVIADVSVTPGTVAYSRAERLLRRSRQPVQRKLWRQIRGKTKQSRSRSRQSRQRDGLSSQSRVETLDAGVRRVLNNSDDFMLIVESTDAAYVSSRPPGCTLTVAHQTTPVAQYRFVIAAATSNSSSWQRRLLQRLDSALTALNEATVIKRLYYKWWTSTECLAHLTDPNVWTMTDTRDTADVDETGDDERIFLQAPVSPADAEPRPSSTTRHHTQTPVSGDELGRDEKLVSEFYQQRAVTQRSSVRRLVDVSTSSMKTTVDNSRHQRRNQSVVLSSTTSVTSSQNTTTTKLTWRPHRERDDDKRHLSKVDDSEINYDDFHLITAAESTADESRLDSVTHSTMSGHVEGEYDDLSCVDCYVKNSSKLIREQDMAVKEHWRRGDVAAIQLISTRASDGSQSAAVTDDSGCVVSRPSVALYCWSLLASLTSALTCIYLNPVTLTLHGR